jgi:hypothetical protein
MKAVDYFNKYKDKVNTPEGLADLLIEMSTEVQEIAKKRNSTRDEVVIPIMKEMNLKWNALCGLFEKEYGQPILIRNGFINYWKAKIQDI